MAISLNSNGIQPNRIASNDTAPSNAAGGQVSIEIQPNGIASNDKAPNNATEEQMFMIDPVQHSMLILLDKIDTKVASLDAKMFSLHCCK